MSKLWYTQTVNCSAIKRNCLLIHTTTWLDWESIMLLLRASGGLSQLSAYGSRHGSGVLGLSPTLGCLLSGESASASPLWFCSCLAFLSQINKIFKKGGGALRCLKEASLRGTYDTISLFGILEKAKTAGTKNRSVIKKRKKNRSVSTRGWAWGEGLTTEGQVWGRCLGVTW